MLTASKLVEQSVMRKMQLCSYLEMGFVCVTCEAGIVTLHGTLPSYFLKQLAQEIVKSVPDVDSVCNECVVASRQSPT